MSQSMPCSDLKEEKDGENNHRGDYRRISRADLVCICIDHGRCTHLEVLALVLRSHYYLEMPYRPIGSESNALELLGTRSGSIACISKLAVSNRSGRAAKS
jgi:hypothetical protein